MRRILILIGAVLLYAVSNGHTYGDQPIENTLITSSNKATKLADDILENLKDIEHLGDTAEGRLLVLYYSKLERIAWVQNEYADGVHVICGAEYMILKAAMETPNPGPHFERMRKLADIYFPKKIRYSENDLQIILTLMGKNSNDAAFVSAATELKNNVRKLQKLLKQTYSALKEVGISD